MEWRLKEKKENQDGEGRQWVGIAVTIWNEEMEWARNGYIGCVQNRDVITDLQPRMIDEGIVTVKFIPMGGEKVFLKIDEEEDFGELVKDGKTFFNRWFSILRKWEPRDAASARYT